MWAHILFQRILLQEWRLPLFHVHTSYVSLLFETGCALWHLHEDYKKELKMRVEANSFLSFHHPSICKICAQNYIHPRQAVSQPSIYFIYQESFSSFDRNVQDSYITLKWETRKEPEDKDRATTAAATITTGKSSVTGIRRITKKIW